MGTASVLPGHMTEQWGITHLFMHKNHRQFSNKHRSFIQSRKVLNINVWIPENKG